MPKKKGKKVGVAIIISLGKKKKEPKNGFDDEYPSEPKGKKLKKKFSRKVAKTMREFKENDMHSGDKSGPIVTNPKQAIAISLSKARKSVESKKKKK